MTDPAHYKNPRMLNEQAALHRREAERCEEIAERSQTAFKQTWRDIAEMHRRAENMYSGLASGGLS